jgi:hypothetical protein
MIKQIQRIQRLSESLFLIFRIFLSNVIPDKSLSDNGNEERRANNRTTLSSRACLAVQHWAEYIEGLEGDKERERNELGEHESHATAALGPLFADSEGRRGAGIPAA